jgi:hypothetical protein
VGQVLQRQSTLFFFDITSQFLRSGFMAVGSFPDGIPNNLSSQINGTMYISTIGWTMRSPTYLAAILPLIILTILNFTCALYSIVQAWKHGNQRLTFDASNTLHLIMASAAGISSLKLAGFDLQRILANEGVEVRLYECEGDRGVTKKFVLVQLPSTSDGEACIIFYLHM